MLRLGDLEGTGWVESESVSDTTFSAGLLADPTCRGLAKSSSVPAATGTATISFAKGSNGEVSLVNEVELFPAAATVEAMRAILTSPQLKTCFTKAAGGGSSGSSEDRATVTAFDVGVLAAELGVDWVAGVQITASFDAGRSSGSFATELAMIGTGRAMTLVGLVAYGSGGGDAARIPTIDLAPPVRVAGRRLKVALGRV